MKTRNISHLINFQLVRNGVAPVICLFLRGKRRKKGAHTFHGICWNFLTIGRKLKELKIVNDGNNLVTYTLFTPLYAEV
jgi:hypothetical protein